MSEKYPSFLSTESAMYKEKKKVRTYYSGDNAPVSARRELLESLFDNYHIYLNETDYYQFEEYPLLKKENGIITRGDGRDLAEWRERHYYDLYEWQGLQFIIMLGS